METSRAARLEAEIEKARAKLAAQQARLKELEAKRTELENTEIVDTVRGMNIPLEELPELLQAIKGGVVTSGQNVQKSAPAKNNTEKENDIE